jgi:hypothetical protein
MSEWIRKQKYGIRKFSLGLLWGNLATQYGSIFEFPLNWPLVTTSVVLTVSLPVGLPSDSRRSALKVHQLRKLRILGEKFRPIAVYTTPATSRFLNRDIRRLKLPMNFLHWNFCAQNHFSYTESPHDSNLTWCCSMIKLFLPTTWACKHSLAWTCHQRTAYVAYLYRRNSTCLGITILSSYLCCSLQEQAIIIFCVSEREREREKKTSI